MACSLFRFSETKTMKNKTTIYAIIVISLLSVSVYGQESLQKGKSLVGGGIGFGISDNESNPDDDSDGSSQESRHFSFSPYYGKFVKDNLLLGVSLNLNTNKRDFKNYYNSGSSHNDFKSKSIGGGVFVRKYFPVVEKFGVFFQPGLNYNLQTSETVYYSSNDNSADGRDRLDESKGHMVSIGANLGLYYFISDRFSIETNLANVNFSKTFRETEQTDYFNNSFTTSKGNSNSIGLDFINQLSFDKIFVINYFF